MEKTSEIIFISDVGCRNSDTSMVYDFFVILLSSFSQHHSDDSFHIFFDIFLLALVIAITRYITSYFLSVHWLGGN